MIKQIGKHLPDIDGTAWIADNATVTGDVRIGAESSVWYTAVIRGDVNRIEIGSKVNIQDGAVVHGSTGGPATVIGDSVSIGHRAIIHGCVIHDRALIGMGAIVLDGVVVESGSMVAAGAVVTTGTVVESGYIYAGTPARKLKRLSPEQVRQYIVDIADSYVVLKDQQ